MARGRLERLCPMMKKRFLGPELQRVDTRGTSRQHHVHGANFAVSMISNDI